MVALHCSRERTTQACSFLYYYFVVPRRANGERHQRGFEGFARIAHERPDLRTW